MGLVILELNVTNLILIKANVIVVYINDSGHGYDHIGAMKKD